MNSLYCDFSHEQLEEFKKKIHSKIHWLLIYKEDYICKDFDSYFNDVMKYISSLNKIFNENPMIIELLVTLQMAYDDTLESNFVFKKYRKHILDAHMIVDKL